MENMKQAQIIRIGEFIKECQLVSYSRLCASYNKMSCWLRNNDLETPFLKLRTAFRQFVEEYNFYGVTSDLLTMVNDVAEKAQTFADECYKHEDCWNPTLDREVTKVIGHTYTVTEWMMTQAKFVKCYMLSIIGCYKEGSLI